MESARIAFRNLYRQKRRTGLTVSIIAFGVVAVILFSSLAGSFKNMMISQITDSMLGHLQVHRSGYVESLDTMPLNLVIEEQYVDQLKKALGEIKEIEGYTLRILLATLLSNYADTTNIKLSAIDPASEQLVTPLLPGRITQGKFLEKGQILLPNLVARGLELGIASEVVVIATNVDGSVNGTSLVVSGIVETAVGPSGKYGYIHIDDARELLRMESLQVSEVAIRLKDSEKLTLVMNKLQTVLKGITDDKGKPVFEVHPWKALSPFNNIANMIDLMTIFIQVILVTIVLISIMNVMLMAVYERTKEIGTIAAIGTPPSSIMSLFIFEGLFLGIAGAAVGNITGWVLVQAVKAAEMTISFGQSDNILLAPQISLSTMLATTFIVILVTLLGAVEPAYKASQLDPVEALRN
ncbi:MAG: ABC transporter substrate-binding protein [Candidatus Riflebacteria bacterium HGW-Riflebacteria-2]|jgi:putative ABC transport system permease protein|nr:MAG: ABC transporter substrate-binding protein [Candidatus Riflebacteria bacterium HGW-Riflebacteria-2]